MAMQKKRSKRYNTKSSTLVVAAPEPTRRDALRRYRNYAIAAGVVGIGGWFVVSDVQATIQENDLTRIGNGVPAIVQIHDPQCSQCLALQKASRAAMEGFDDAELQFLVANIRGGKGGSFAGKHGARHVTLLYFDGKGNRQHIERGVKSSAYLESSFRRFLSGLK